jgi:hypothetical protein
MKKLILNMIRRICGTKGLIEKLDIIQRQNQTILNAQIFQNAISDCVWLKYKSFSPGGWAMDNAGFYTLFRILNDVKPKNIVEFGLGQSSKMVHQYALFSSGVSALTIEHDDKWIEFLREGSSKDIAIKCEIFETLTIDYKGFKTLTYKNIDRLNTIATDLYIVDGPFGSYRYSRPQIINIVQKGLKNRFCIFIDDTERQGEKDTVKEICEILQNSSIKYCIREYFGEEKYHTVICSDDLKYLTSLR